MDAMFQADRDALALAELLRQARARDVVALDLRDLNSWTDFFVIATVNSGAHRSGLERHVKEFARERGFEILRRSRRPSGGLEDEWSLIDLGGVVVHLMTEKSRLFYELERLWGAHPLHPDAE